MPVPHDHNLCTLRKPICLMRGEARQQPRLNTKPRGVPKSTRQDRMRKAMVQGPTDGAVKVQLDARTLITLKSAAALDFWRARYPELRIIND